MRCWRLKYALPSGFVLYDSYPTNRASGNELFIAELANAVAASTAVKSLRRTMGPESQETATWEFAGHGYALYAETIKNRRTWSQAKAFCEQRGGHLITLGSQEEQNALSQAMLQAKTANIFIGLKGDWRSNAWAWVTGEPVTFRGWPIKNRQEVYGADVQELPQGRYPVQFTQAAPNMVSKLIKNGKLDVGWYLAEPGRQSDTGFFVCEWEGPRPASKVVQRVSTRDRFVVMQSFACDAPAGETLLRRAVEK